MPFCMYICMYACLYGSVYLRSADMTLPLRWRRNVENLTNFESERQYKDNRLKELCVTYVCNHKYAHICCSFYIFVWWLYQIFNYKPLTIANISDFPKCFLKVQQRNYKKMDWFILNLHKYECKSIRRTAALHCLKSFYY